MKTETQRQGKEWMASGRQDNQLESDTLADIASFLGVLEVK